MRDCELDAGTALRQREAGSSQCSTHNEFIPDGMDGADGNDGDKGAKGDKGDKGDTGANGAAGTVLRGCPKDMSYFDATTFGVHRVRELRQGLFSHWVRRHEPRHVPEVLRSQALRLSLAPSAV